jgi:hypothetical protein
MGKIDAWLYSAEQAAKIDALLANRRTVFHNGRCRLMAPLLGCYRLARRASVTTNEPRKLERALLSSSDWRHITRGIDGWAKLMLEGFDGDCRLLYTPHG